MGLHRIKGLGHHNKLSVFKPDKRSQFNCGILDSITTVETIQATLSCHCEWTKTGIQHQQQSTLFRKLSFARCTYYVTFTSGENEKRHLAYLVNGLSRILRVNVVRLSFENMIESCYPSSAHTPQQLENSEDQDFFFPENWLVSTDHHTTNVQ